MVLIDILYNIDLEDFVRIVYFLIDSHYIIGWQSVPLICCSGFEFTWIANPPPCLCTSGVFIGFYGFRGSGLKAGGTNEAGRRDQRHQGTRDAGPSNAKDHAPLSRPTEAT